MAEILENVFDEGHPLSNCYILPDGMGYNGVYFRSAEHAYQAQKFDWKNDLGVIQLIMHAQGGPDASRIARENASKVRPDWEVVRVEIMYEVMRQKFLQIPSMMEFLLSTSPETLYEEADTPEFASAFWGCDANGEGENVIGNILMTLRDEFIGSMRY